MPTYEYRCSQGHQFEQFQRMSEPPVSECPQCGAPAERLLSAGAGLLFKGSGFYITDYRSDSYRKAAAADGGGSTGSGGGSGDSGGSEAGGRKDAAPAPSPAPKKTGGDSAGGAASS